MSWTALDYALEPPGRRSLRVSLDSDQTAAELARVMDEGVEIASGSGIGDTEQTEGAADSGGGYREGRQGTTGSASSGAAKQVWLPLATLSSII